jgi:hypothetical protein
MLSENERWILSFYRTSEISGALFFGRLAGTMRPGAIQRDMTKHFADESNHAWYWTACLESLGAKPLKLADSYQDRYLQAAGLPANVMEVLAITQVFERRVIGQYSLHSQAQGVRPEIQATLRTIMEDEKWHIVWVRDALKQLEADYGAERIEKTLERFVKADREVYEATLDEHSERLRDLLRRAEEDPK